MNAEHRPLIEITVLLCIITLFLSAVSHRALATRVSPFSGDPVNLSVLEGISAALSIPALVAVDLGDDEGSLSRKQITIKSGDTLSGIFYLFRISDTELTRVLKADRFKVLRFVKPNEKLLFVFNAQNELQSLYYSPNNRVNYHFSKQADGRSYVAAKEDVELERRVVFRSGVIKNSLAMAAYEVGLPEKVMMDLTDIFGWDIDFFHDIRKGDSFNVLFEELYQGGQKKGVGNILAAEFVNQGKHIRAFRFKSEERIGYYTEIGKNLSKAFIRTPVKFSRISSHFNLKRHHPILHKIRAHKGVDYAAARGTPVRATGDGVVKLAGKKGGYGRTVILQHGNKYTTLYAHLQRYSKGLYTGKRVKQGQVIGYIGSSGLATGPHLHYEFRVYGVHKNPLKVPFPDAAPLVAMEKKMFKQQVAKLSKTLATYQKLIGAVAFSQ